MPFNWRRKSSGIREWKGSCVQYKQGADAADLISIHDIVISMLPARFHPEVATLCLRYSKHLLTASYISEDMKALDEAAKASGLLFLNECGLDPGIDHMSAKKVIDHIRIEKVLNLKLLSRLREDL